MQLFGVSAGNGAMAVGYLIMLVALSFIVVAVRQFRDKERGGYIGFWPAFGLGLAIAAVAGVVYVLLWEAYLASTGYNAFMAQYVEAAVEAKRAAGATAAELETAAAEMQEMATMPGKSANPHAGDIYRDISRRGHRCPDYGAGAAALAGVGLNNWLGVGAAADAR